MEVSYSYRIREEIECYYVRVLTNEPKTINATELVKRLAPTAPESCANLKGICGSFLVTTKIVSNRHYSRHIFHFHDGTDERFNPEPVDSNSWTKYHKMDLIVSVDDHGLYEARVVGHDDDVELSMDAKSIIHVLLDAIHEYCDLSHVRRLGYQLVPDLIEEEFMNEVKWSH